MSASLKILFLLLFFPVAAIAMEAIEDSSLPIWRMKKENDFSEEANEYAFQEAQPPLNDFYSEPDLERWSELCYTAQKSYCSDKNPIQLKGITFHWSKGLINELFTAHLFLIKLALFSKTLSEKVPSLSALIQKYHERDSISAEKDKYQKFYQKNLITLFKSASLFDLKPLKIALGKVYSLQDTIVQQQDLHHIPEDCLSYIPSLNSTITINQDDQPPLTLSHINANLLWSGYLKTLNSSPFLKTSTPNGYSLLIEDDKGIKEEGVTVRDAFITLGPLVPHLNTHTAQEAEENLKGAIKELLQDEMESLLYISDLLDIEPLKNAVNSLYSFVPSEELPDIWKSHLFSVRKNQYNLIFSKSPQLRSTPQNAFDLAVDSTNSYLATSAINSEHEFEVIIYNAKNFASSFPIPFPSPIHELCWIGSRLIALSYENKKIYTLDSTSDFKKVKEFSLEALNENFKNERNFNNKRILLASCLTNDNQYWVLLQSIGKSGYSELLLVNIETGKELRTIYYSPYPSPPAYHACFNKDGSQLFIASTDKLFVWDMIINTKSAELNIEGTINQLDYKKGYLKVMHNNNNKVSIFSDEKLKDFNSLSATNILDASGATAFLSKQISQDKNLKNLSTGNASFRSFISTSDSSLLLIDCDCNTWFAGKDKNCWRGHYFLLYDLRSKELIRAIATPQKLDLLSSLGSKGILTPKGDLLFKKDRDLYRIDFSHPNKPCQSPSSSFIHLLFAVNKQIDKHGKLPCSHKKSKLHKKLNDLSSEEKEWLKPYYSNASHTIGCHIIDFMQHKVTKTIAATAALSLPFIAMNNWKS